MTWEDTVTRGLIVRLASLGGQTSQFPSLTQSSDWSMTVGDNVLTECNDTPRTRRALVAGLVVAFAGAADVMAGDRIRRHNKRRNKRDSKETSVSIPGEPGEPGKPGQVTGGPTEN